MRSGKVADFKFVSHRKEIDNTLNNQIAQTLEAWGLKAERYAKEEVPVDTSRLKNSITFVTNTADAEMIVGTNVEYAEYVETNDDAHHDSGRAHYMRDSIALHVDEYESIANKFLRV